MAAEKPSGKALGGIARASKMSPEERKAASEKALAAKKELAALPKATHTGNLKLIDTEIPCAVLEDGTRVLTQSDFMEAMGMYYSGWIANNSPSDHSLYPAEVPHFLAQKTLIPFINKHLGHLQNIVLKYKTEKGAAAHGIRAEIIPSICDIYLDAEKAGKLGARQAKIAQKAMLLMRALAHVGIVALVDEATGFQKDRERDALAKILETFVARELQPYMKTFPADYYEQLFRLRGLPYPPEVASFRPQYFGKLTNDIVYKRIAPGLLAELKRQNEKDERKGKLHQRLTLDIGYQKLRDHISAVVMAMKLSKDYPDFIEKMNQFYPRYGDNFQLELEAIDHG
ncbi:hypothetical protein CR152_27745 [Massilia violaceinigra]|uniref:Bacteriophage Mx8 p63 C-terminal domain-containing protein n=1 Tax=Massilia violaceinigra TaxID=2045208 RepID=A0A2D2DSB4_9BURK|nr:P63C domain-containing protein [Massilia violaceinigra]ATQ77872.1 hypothetical protein CR152_27745 [Massilia violaceinigra]